ncbi:MAG: hypothetical protein KF739_01950 [Cryobacterium sp.]|nr:hypothetical protein [Cryobacterium sp.]
MTADLGDNGRVLNLRRAVRATLIVGIVFATAGALTGCLQQGGVPEPSPTASSSTPTPSPTPSATPSASASPVEQPTPVSIPCGTVVDAQTMYDFNPNFGLLSSFEPASNTLSARAVQDKGTVCRWMNQTSRITIDIAISSPGPTALAAAKDAAKAGSAVSGIGDEAYFSVSGGIGTLQAFSGQFWVSAASPAFASSADAATLVKSAVASTN